MAFVAGWNAHLQEVGADGLSGWCAGEEWVQPIEPVDLYAYARSIAVYASAAAISISLRLPAGNRFTAYRLELVDGDPTSYRYGDEEREMTSTDITVEVQPSRQSGLGSGKPDGTRSSATVGSRSSLSWQYSRVVRRSHRDFVASTHAALAEWRKLIGAST